MKVEPTDPDREAARLFNPAPGMRVFNAYSGWGRLAEAAWAGTTLIHWATDSLAVAGHARVDAIDTDDPATVGCMLAQVDAAAGTDDVSVEKLKPYGRGFAVFIRGSYSHAPAPTRGAALVAADGAAVLRGARSAQAEIG